MMRSFEQEKSRSPSALNLICVNDRSCPAEDRSNLSLMLESKDLGEVWVSASKSELNRGGNLAYHVN